MAQESALQVQINHIDYVLAASGPLDNSNLPNVPVLRIFGSSSLNKKTCVHIHQVYPYFFIEYLGDLAPKHVRHYIAKLIRSLNHAIAVSLKRNPSSSKSQFIRSIILVKGIHFYGFHSAYSPFLKVYLADPALLSRTVALLQTGSVMSKRFRVYESHIGYILQFLSDFGLYGCGWLELGGDVLQRQGRSNPTDDDEQSPDLIFPLSTYLGQSRMSLEVDVAAHQILNRHKLVPRSPPPNPDGSPSCESDEPLVLSVRELWEDERKRRRARGLKPSPDLPIDPSDASRGVGGGWSAEARWWDELRQRIQGEKGDIPPAKQEWEKHIMSTFESVEALWERPFRTWKPPTRDPVAEDSVVNGEHKDAENDDVDIDISMISDPSLTQLIDEENRMPGDELDAWGEQVVEDDVSPEDQEEPGTPARSPSPPLIVEQEYEDPFRDDDNASDAGSHHGSAPRQDSQQPFPTGDHASRATSTNDVSLIHVPSAEAHSHMNDMRGETLFPLSKERRESTPGHIFSSPSPSLRHLAPLLPRQSLTLGTRTFHPHIEFKLKQVTSAFTFATKPPTVSELMGTLEQYNLPGRLYRAPYYSSERDVPTRSWEYGGLVFRLRGDRVADLDEWLTSDDPSKSTRGTRLDSTGIPGWEYASVPPSVRSTKQWLLQNPRPQSRMRQKLMRSQIEGPTQLNPFGFNVTPGQTATQVSSREKLDMTIMCLEVFALSQEGKVPDPSEDEIVSIFYAYQEADSELYSSAILAIDTPILKKVRLKGTELHTVADELDLINDIVDTIVFLDPDVLVGWDVQSGSWGYLDARAQAHGLDLADLISRAPLRRTAGSVQWEVRHNSTFKVSGRHTLNLWRVLRVEVTLNVYTFENAAFNILKRRVPKYAGSTLNMWYLGANPSHIDLLLRYFSDRAGMVLDMLYKTEVVTKTAEFARVFGVDFYSVLTRGSQYKVESFMFRIAKPESFVLISPSKADVGKQNAAECMPLIMEPQSAFYSSPLVVLDFQSLYPSVMIAYNYCYSTCLGRIRDFQGKNKLGVIDYERPPGLFEKYQNNMFVAPNGIAYVKQQVRKGLLGRMLTELLDTRVMVKQAMKAAKNDKALRRILDARQLGLKYIANVTYGYTGATFSGRMPIVELADSIVQTGRETLEKAIFTINNNPKWKAEVVYGDTDSLFIYLRGRTKEQAFRLGHEIADTITAQNPKPIKLKFEKVYLPCVLMAKKRYVGFMYESIDDQEPAFDAKGIETVRRDGVPAQAKMTERCLKTLFRTQDLSEIKAYCVQSWTKLLENRLTIQDFIFAKEVRMGTYSDHGPPPPGVVVAARRIARDPNDEAQYAERVRYVIVRSSTRQRLVDKALDPHDMLKNRSLRLDAEYYISRVLIPPLERIFNLVGADVRRWYNEMPKPKYRDILLSPTKSANGDAGDNEAAQIDGHFTSSQCFLCRQAAYDGLCYDCRKDRPTTLSSLLSHVRTSEKLLTDAHSVCSTCTRSPTAEPIECISLDCPWFYARYKAEEKVELIAVLNQLIREVESEDPDALAERVLQEELALSEWSDVTEISDDELPSHSPV